MKPKNVNVLHQAELDLAGFNQKLAVNLTKIVGTVWCAYLFLLLAILGLLGILGFFNPIVVLLVSWTSQTLIQLVLLPIIMVGQAVISRKQELQAEEQFQTTEKSFQDVEQILGHLNAQDEKILALSQKLDLFLAKKESQ